MPATVAVPLITAAVAGGAQVYGARRQGQSARRAQDIQSRSDDAALEDARQQREEDRRRFEIEEANRQREFAAAEEERAYRRQQDEYQQQLLREREARAAPYRAASAQALGNLGQMLGIDLSQQQAAMTAPRTTTPAPAGPSRTGDPWSPQSRRDELWTAQRSAIPPITLGAQVGMTPRRRLS